MIFLPRGISSNEQGALAFVYLLVGSMLTLYPGIGAMGAFFCGAIPFGIFLIEISLLGIVFIVKGYMEYKKK